jgi:hypothetical protein
MSILSIQLLYQLLLADVDAHKDQVIPERKGNVQLDAF